MALLAVTIGDKLEAKVNHYFANNQFTKATVLDAIGSIAAEEVANYITTLISKKAKDINLPYLTMRYSPGYGDLELDIQPKLLKLLKEDKLGIKTNSSHLLIPQKSITALIGLGNTKSAIQAKCDFNCINCQLDNCIYN